MHYRIKILFSIGPTPRTHLSVFNDNIESLFIEIDKDVIHYDKPVIVGAVYRPPSFDMTTFNKKMNVRLSEFNNTNNYLYYGGLPYKLINVDSHIGLRRAYCRIFRNDFFALLHATHQYTY